MRGTGDAGSIEARGVVGTAGGNATASATLPDGHGRSGELEYLQEV